MKRFQLDCMLSPDPSTYPNTEKGSRVVFQCCPDQCGTLSTGLHESTAPHICVLPSAPALAGYLPSTSGVHPLLLALFTTTAKPCYLPDYWHPWFSWLLTSYPPHVCTPSIHVHFKHTHTLLLLVG